MARFIAKNKPVNNSDLKELNGFVPPDGSFVNERTKNGETIKISSLYIDDKLTIEISVNGGLKYSLKTEVSAKESKTMFKGDGWEKKFFNSDDTIKGSTASDVLFGFNGSDSIEGKGGDDTIRGGAGPDSLYGGGGGDSIFGALGNDFLNGDAGFNTLTGGGGRDTFAFDAALIGGNRSEITDFQSKDTIQLASSTFVGIGSKGTLASGKFFLASDYAGKAKSVVYDDATGNLYYAKNGGDLANAQLFARIGNGAGLDNHDFLIA